MKTLKTKRLEAILRILDQERGSHSISDISDKLKALGLKVSVTTL
jgi:hypothetical protein